MLLVQDVCLSSNLLMDMAYSYSMQKLGERLNHKLWSNFSYFAANAAWFRKLLFILVYLYVSSLPTTRSDEIVGDNALDPGKRLADFGN